VRGWRSGELWGKLEMGGGPGGGGIDGEKKKGADIR